MLAHVADNVGVVRALGEEHGDDRRARLGLADRRQLARCCAPTSSPPSALLSVPYSPRGGPRPTDVFAQIGGDEEFYISYFQAPGRAEAEIEPDVRGWLRGFYAALAGDAASRGSSSPRAAGCADRFPADAAAAGLDATSTSTPASSSAPG